MKIFAVLSLIAGAGFAFASIDEMPTVATGNITTTNSQGSLLRRRLVEFKTVEPHDGGDDEASSTASAVQQHRSLNMVPDFRWKDRRSGFVIVPYTISPSVGSTDRSKIRSAMDNLESKTGCLEFVQRSSQGHYIKIVRLADKGCSSQIGTSGGPQNLNLASDCMNPGTIQHELMHALGFYHEHTRTDRDQYVTILWDNIKDRRWRKNYEIAHRSTTLGSPYDYGSVMHYSAGGSPAKPIIIANGNEIGQRDGPSDTDIKKIKLMYQCERGLVRQWNSLISSPCTSECMCRKGDTGCGSNDDACHGSLVCSNNKCVTGGSAPTPTPPPSLDNKFLIWQSLPNGAKDDVRCFDAKGGSVTNGNDVWYYPCNFTPAQYWYRETSTAYIRSSIDRNKCLVGAGGSTTKGTRLVINDCFANDNRFKWYKYDDESIRPAADNSLCIKRDPNADTGDDTGLFLILADCVAGYVEWKWQSSSSSGRKKLLSETEPELQGSVHYRSGDGCVDSPIGWYDIFGRNCEWYGEVESNCAVYGDQYKNFGKTALSACCVCGGGPSNEKPSDIDHAQENAVEASQSQSCWDSPDWYDSNGDGCDWYYEENNCEYFGSQFASSIDELTANEACCVCSGGLSGPPLLSDAVADAEPGCSNSPFDWFDDAGVDCVWYALEERNCLEFGDDEGADGKTANEVCCACGGGFDPNRVFDDSNQLFDTGADSDSNQTISLVSEVGNDSDGNISLSSKLDAGGANQLFDAGADSESNQTIALVSEVGNDSYGIISLSRKLDVGGDDSDGGNQVSEAMKLEYQFPMVVGATLLALAFGV